jgi:NTE family protein
LFKPFSLFSKKPLRLGLALGGGGARGIAHIAFLKVLDELGLRPAVISGTSMGALIGALYASGHSGLALESLIKNLKLVDLVSLADFTWLGAAKGLIKGERVVKLLAKLTQGKRFEDLALPLKVVAADFWNRREVVFDRGSVMEAVRASISLPGIFEPVVRDQQVLVDGGIVNSLPYELIRRDCDVLAAINVVGEIAPVNRQEPKPNIFEALLWTFNIMEATHIDFKLGQSRPDLYFKPKLPNIGILDFHRIDNILDSVAEDAAEFKSRLQTLFRLTAPRP